MSSKKFSAQMYADECIPVPTSTYLKSKGISVIHAYDIKFIQKSDSIHLRKSKTLNRVLLSLDKDFKKFRDAKLNDHPGIILVSVSKAVTPAINAVLDKALKHLSGESIKNAIVRITNDHIFRDREGMVEVMDLNKHNPRWRLKKVELA